MFSQHDVRQFTMDVVPSIAFLKYGDKSLHDQANPYTFG